MARMRTVKPALRTSEVVGRWPREVRYFFVLLWGYLDDKGRGLDLPKQIAGDCFPLPGDDDVKPSTVDRWLTLISTTKDPADPNKPPPLCRYEVRGRRYIHCLNFGEHQKPNRPTPSALPPCPIHESLTEPGSESLTEPCSEPSSEPLTESPLSPHTLVLEGLRGRGVEGARRESGSEAPPDPTAALEPEPLATCREHRDDPDPPACRRCKTARERHEAWLAAKRARLTAAPRCPEHPAELAHNCRLCRSERLGAA